MVLLELKRKFAAAFKLFDCLLNLSVISVGNSTAVLGKLELTKSILDNCLKINPIDRSSVDYEQLIITYEACLIAEILCRTSLALWEKSFA